MKTMSLFLLLSLMFVATPVVQAAGSGAAQGASQGGGATVTTTSTLKNDKDAKKSDELTSQPAAAGHSKQPTNQDLAIFQLLSFSLLLLVLFPLIWLRTQKSSAGHSTSAGPLDSQAVAHAINSAIAQRTAPLATAQNVSSSEANLKKLIAEMGSRLVDSVAKAAAVEVNKTQLGEVTAKCDSLEAQLSRAQQDLADEKRRTAATERERDAERERIPSFEKTAEDAILEKNEAERKCADLRKSLENLEIQLKSSREEIQKRDQSLVVEQARITQLLAEANKGYEVLAPAKLRETELRDQIHSMYQEALSGNPASISAWTTLTAFVSAQADPTAKDFQLQIVRRLGVTLINCWKHQGLSEKERHDKLVHWAKALNEHADGRYNLLVPTLGEPVDRSRMSCATSVTAVREVLCWQVRNPAGANFSLAEVA